MKQFLICLALLMPILPALAEAALPREVQRFVDRREGCDHLRSELRDPNERQRMTEVTREITRLCAGTDKELAQLKRKYAANSTIMQILNQLETGLEAIAVPAPKSKAGNRTG